ncbi:unnamed protein product [Brassica rapa subsp. trilocularis]
MIYPEDEGVEQRHGIHIAYKEDCVNLILTIVPSSDLFVFLVSAGIETLSGGWDLKLDWCFEEEGVEEERKGGEKGERREI